jgi:dipeptidyl aminopeptidase/acylaminoacyl peptidase
MLRRLLGSFLALGLVCLACIGLGAQAVAAAPPLEAYGKLPQIEDITLSPSGKRVAFVTVVGEIRKLVISEIEGGKPLVVTALGDSKVRDIIWAGEEHVIMFQSQTQRLGSDFQGSRAELSAAYHINLKTHQGYWLMGGKTPVAIMGFFGVRGEGEHWYAWIETFDQTYELVLNKIDLENERPVLVSKGNRGSVSYFLGPDGAVVAHSVYDSKSGEWRLRSGATGGDLLMQRDNPLHDLGAEGLGRTPDTVLISDDTSGEDVYSEVPTHGGGAPARLLEGRRLSGPIHDRHGLLIGFTTWEGSGAVIFDPEREARYRAMRRAFPGYNAAMVSATDDFARMIVLTDGKDDAGTYWIVDTATGQASELGKQHPDITSADVGMTQMVRYKAADGLDLDGLLTLPPGRSPVNLPLVVMPHGGPIAPGDRPGFDWWAQAYASRGYAVFQPNFRGTDGYGVAFRAAATGEWGGKMQTDVSDGVAALGKRGLIDPKRVCIVGASYGGYAALAGVTLQHGVYRCAVSVGGLSNLRAMMDWEAAEKGHDSLTLRYWRDVMGVQSNHDEVLKARSPGLHADQADAPVLLIHGKDDTVVPIAQSEEMVRRLDKAGKAGTLVTLEGEDHWLSREATRAAMLKASVTFVLEHNPPE